MSVLAVSFSKSISLVPFPIRLIIKHAFCDDAHMQGNITLIMIIIVAGSLAEVVETQISST